MNMRYVTVPPVAIVVDFWQNPQTGEVVTRGTKPFSYFDLLDEMVWSLPDWRKDELYAAVYNRVYASHQEARKEGYSSVPMLETDYAVFAPLATLQGKPLGGPNVHAINLLTQAVTFASSNPPEKGCSP